MFIKVPHKVLHSWLAKLVPDLDVRNVRVLSPHELMAALGEQDYAHNTPQLVELNIVFDFVHTRVQENVAPPWLLADYVTHRQHHFAAHGEMIHTPLGNHGLDLQTSHSTSAFVAPTPLRPEAPPYQAVSNVVLAHQRDQDQLSYTSFRPASVHSFPCAAPSVHAPTSGGIQGTHGTSPTAPLMGELGGSSGVPMEVDPSPGGGGGGDDGPPSKSLRSWSSSVRKQRAFQHHIRKGGVKTRGFIGSDKLVWKDGTAATFGPFEKDVEGTLMKLGMSYLLNPEVQQAYLAWGTDIATNPTFYEETRITQDQFDYDVQYLFGILWSSTKNYDDANLIQNKNTMDGLRAWLGLVETYGHMGNKTLKKEQLLAKVMAAYNPNSHKHVGDYLDKFHSWANQITALVPHLYKDLFFKDVLLANLKHDPSLLSLLKDCRTSPTMTLKDTVAYIKEHAMIDQDAAGLSTRLRKLNFTTNDDGGDDSDATVDKAFDTIQSLLETHDVKTVYNTLSMPMVRESLFIPQAVWRELEPALRIKVLEAKKKAQAKQKANESSKDGAVAPKPSDKAVEKIPSSNYPDVNKRVVNLMNSMARINMDSDSDDTMEDGEERHAKMTICVVTPSSRNAIRRCCGACRRRRLMRCTHVDFAANAPVHAKQSKFTQMFW